MLRSTVSRVVKSLMMTAPSVSRASMMVGRGSVRETRVIWGFGRDEVVRSSWR